MDLTAVFEGGKINRYTPSDAPPSQNKGRRVGIAYELENGDMVKRAEPDCLDTFGHTS